MNDSIEKYNCIKAILKQESKNAGWLAGKLNIGIETVYKWNINKNQPTIKQLFKIAGVLGVSVADLLEIPLPKTGSIFNDKIFIVSENENNIFGVCQRINEFLKSKNAGFQLDAEQAKINDFNLYQFKSGFELSINQALHLGKDKYKEILITATLRKK